MRSAEIRERFLRYFEAKGHERVPSSSLVPAGDDRSLLFTNSGMAQFKDVFLGFDKRPYRRATTAQKCLRAGGKHNDLDNVGHTTRHHTFFEMLGNFSFGDYFKRDAVPYAWEFLTSPDWLGIDRRHLWITVFGGGRLFGPGTPEIPPDEEAHGCWMEVLTKAGFSAEEAERRITRVPTTDNFWMMGDVGPCGPCSEIFHNPDPEASRFEGDDEERADICVEIWNLVFMEYSRDDKGGLKPLPAPCVDTGMGLERISSVLQGVRGNFEIDLFTDLMAEVRRATGFDGKGDPPGGAAPFRVIADHVRAASFLVADGVAPDNDGRGYVLRRIIRRALRHGHQLGTKELFFHKLVRPLARLMGDAYPELARNAEGIEGALRQEEESFARTLATGMAILERELGRIAKEGSRTVDGAVAFELYDTYGFPPDLTGDIARGRGCDVDMGRFEALMEEQRSRSRAASAFAAEAMVEYGGAATEFTGHSGLEGEAEVVALFVDGAPADHAPAGKDALAVLSPTPFYARAGGQVGDTGTVEGPDGEAEVTDTVKMRADVSMSSVSVRKGAIRRGSRVTCKVDGSRRALTASNHSATHLVHAALREVLGRHVEQRGSLVAPDHLRFDFSHHSPVTRDEMAAVERLVNDHVRGNHGVETREMAYKDAIEAGATALFGEKYGDRVRVVSMSPFSVELCGGTHVGRTGDIGLFKLRSEASIAAGVRRIEAVSGPAAIDAVQETERRLLSVAEQVRAPAERVGPKVAQLQEALHGLEKRLEAMGAQGAQEQVKGLVRSARQVGPARVVTASVDGAGPKELRAMAEQANQAGDDIVLFLASAGNGAASLVASVGKSLAGKVDARDIVGAAAEEVGGRGGGRPELAQAGGRKAERIGEAIRAAEQLIASRLG